jgi:DNA modification methylase
MIAQKPYSEFLKAKVVIAEKFGIDTSDINYTEKLFPHQRDIVSFCLEGGRRAIFASFGLGKTFMQLEIAKQLIKIHQKPFLIVCPLGVSGEFKRDNRKLGTGLQIDYITDTDDFENANVQIYLTNYERIRKGDINPELFCGVSFDEASILRNLQTETTNYVLKHFKQVPFRFVATATPTPNDFIEILNYADYLGVISRGHALTRFFQRDSTKAGQLKLYENKKKEFWQWVSTWAAFINKPSDLGYDDTGYDLPELNIIDHCIKYDIKAQPVNKWGEPILFKDMSKSLLEVSREKRDSLTSRCQWALKVILQHESEAISKDFQGKEQLSERLLPETQGNLVGKTTPEEQSQLLKEKAGIQCEKQKMGIGQSGSDERVAEKEPAVSKVESIPQKSLPDEQIKNQRASEGEQTTEGLWDNSSSISNYVGGSTGQVLDMRANECGISAESKRQPGGGSLPQDKESSWLAMSPLQRSTRTVSGEYSNNAKSNRLSQQLIIWCDLNAEQHLIEKMLTANGISYVSIFGRDTSSSRESKMDSWRNNEVDVFLSKLSMFGCGINMQQASLMVYAGITYKFHEFIQGIHRCYRFGQKQTVNVHLIYTENEYEVMKTLRAKWSKHIELNNQMIALVKENGLNANLIKSQMERQLFEGGRKISYDHVTLYNNDTVVVHSDKKEMPDNSVDMILTSIPFGDHYEYSDNYNDFGHNHGNENFFKQMDFLTPNLLRVLKPGRVAAIHVKDRIRYSYQNGTSFTTIADFSGQTVAHFIKHGFYLMGKITVTTDVVAENNQTYRLGWTEQCKDASKMGCGMPEYVLLFRKAPTHADNSYGDFPVTKEKSDYTKALWQLDAHAYQRSNGDRFLTKEELEKLDLGKIAKAWKKLNESEIYDFREHLRVCEDLDDIEKLSSTFMTLPVHSNNDMVWSDVNRMNTLNAKQVNGKKEKHICPLQFDIIERLINRYSMKGELIDDPFGGLFSTPYKALELERRAVSVELNSEYFYDGLYYIKAKLHKLSIPTLFDTIKESA